MRNKGYWLGFAGLLWAALGAAGASLPADVHQVASVEGITEYRLANGLKILLFPDASKQTATVNITYLVGSRHEQYGERGMAHLLEHLMFRGTPRHSDIPAELNAHGARPNGTTWFDRTNYFETFQATDANLEWAVGLEADRMINAPITAKELGAEITVVRNELELGENKMADVLQDRVLSTAWLWHNYGHITTGVRSDLEHVPVERLLSFYQYYYQPDNAVLAISGKFESGRALDLVKKYFGAIPRPRRALAATYTVEPAQDGERSVTLRRAAGQQALCVAYHVPSGQHPDFAAVELLTEILGGSPSGRLYKNLVETGKATAVEGLAFQLAEPGVAIFQVEVRKQVSLDAARNTLLAVVEGASRVPITDQELGRARTKLLNDLDLTFQNPERAAVHLSEAAGMGDWRLAFLHRDRLRRVSAEDVANASKRYFLESNRTLGRLLSEDAPVRAEIPAPPDVAALVRDYKGGQAAAPGEEFDPSVANIEKRIQQYDLRGGLKLTLLPKKSRAHSVVAILNLHFGDLTGLQGRSLAGEFTSQMLMLGTAKRTRAQIQDELDRLEARATVAGGAAEAVVNLETTSENLPDALKLMTEVLREPRFDPAEFERLRQAWLARLEEQSTDPYGLGLNALRRALNPYPKSDVRYVPPVAEEIAAAKLLDLEAVKSFYTDFYGASTAELTVVGDFDSAALKAQAEASFGDWKSRRPFREVTKPYQRVPPANIVVNTPDKSSAFFMAATTFPAGDRDPDYPALVFANYLLGGAIYNSRLSARVRYQDGLSYGIFSTLDAQVAEKAGHFVVFAAAAPVNVAKLEAAFLEEMRRALADGFLPDEVDAAKRGWAQAQQVSRAQDLELAKKLGTLRFYSRTMHWIAELETRIQALTPGEIRDALRRNLDLSALAIVKSGDFGKNP